MRFVVLLVIFALAGCAGGPVTPFASRAASPDFDRTLAAVRPVAEAMCRQTPRARTCGFQIVIDDRPGQPPNAFQSLNAHGQPVLTFTSGLIAATHNDDELALIIAHEAAHHIAGHLARQMQTVDGGPVSQALLTRAIAAAEGNRIDAARFGLAPAGADVDQKSFELEADRIGAQIALLAGFDPSRAAALFDRLPDPVQHPASRYPSNVERARAVLSVAGPARM